MSRFLFKATGLIIGIWGLLNILGFIANYIQPQDMWATIATNNYSSFVERKEDLQAIAIGNSHTGAIDFDKLGLDGQHLTRAGADLFEVKMLTDHVIEETPNLEVAFITISYFSFLRNNAVANDTRILRINLYAMLPEWRPLEGDGNNLVLGKLQNTFRIMDVVRPDNWQGIISNFTKLSNFNFINEANSSETISVTANKNCESAIPAQLDSIAYGRVYSQIEQANEVKQINENIFNDSYSALATTIETLQSHNIRVILFTPTYHKTYNDQFRNQSPTIIDDMHLAVQSLQDTYQVEYYDLSDDIDLSEQSIYFKDSDHMNNCGREAFSARLLETIEREQD